MKRDRRRRTGICGALPFRRSAAPERDVDTPRPQYDALDMQSHKIAVAEFATTSAVKRVREAFEEERRRQLREA
jgi:hypothetical protein